MFIYFLFWIVEIYLIINSIVITISSNFNIGRLLLYAVTIVLLLILVFIKPLTAFTQAGFGLWLKVIFFVGCGILFALIAFILLRGYTQKPSYTEKTVVVLGAGLRGEKVSDVLKRRLDACLDYYSQNPDCTIIVTGGQGDGEDIPEAVAMRKYLVENNIPYDKILIEDKSTSTKENLLFAKQIMDQQKILVDDGVVIVTNNFHCYRASEYAKKLGYTNISTMPASIHLGGAVSSFLREVLAVLWLWFLE